MIAIRTRPAAFGAIVFLLVGLLLASCGDEEPGLPSGPIVNEPFTVEGLAGYWTANRPRSVRVRAGLPADTILPGNLGALFEIVTVTEGQSAVAGKVQVLQDETVEQEIQFMLINDRIYMLPNAQLDNWIFIEAASGQAAEFFSPDELMQSAQLIPELLNEVGLVHSATEACGDEECHFISGPGANFAIHSGHWIPRYVLLTDSDSGSEFKVDVVGWNEDVVIAPPENAEQVTEDQFLSVLFTVGALRLL